MSGLDSFILRQVKATSSILIGGKGVSFIGNAPKLLQARELKKKKQSQGTNPKQFARTKHEVPREVQRLR